jgi:OPA family glycerol-3-phosphate transporter-like MFS transporter 1/2
VLLFASLSISLRVAISLRVRVSSQGNLSTVFDMGGILGGIVAGGASDYSGKRGVVSCVMLLLCLPALQLYSSVASVGLAVNIIVMFIVGVLVNGPYTLISSAVAADLGNHPSLKGNPKAMSTVTGIIDGCGSVGAALQGVLIGLVGNRIGWSNGTGM